MGEVVTSAPSPPAAPERKRFPLDPAGADCAYQAMYDSTLTTFALHSIDDVLRLGVITDPRIVAAVAMARAFKVEIDEGVPAGVVEVR